MIIHFGGRESSTSTHGSTSPQRPPRKHGRGKKERVLPNGLELEALPSDISLFQSIRQIVQIQQRKVFHPWRDIGDLDASYDFLYPDNVVEKCPVEKADQLSTDEQVVYMQWIEKILKIDRKNCKDPRLYCGYCDMNNHPRFTCKHVHKHQKPNEKHRCTLCAGRHPPFLCPIAQINGGDAKPNWYKCEYKRAKQENREPDYRWGADLVTHTDVDSPVESPQCPAAEQQPQCAAAAMMHGVSRPPASSWQNGCPTIAEHQEFMPPMQQSMQPEVILPNPGHKIAANLWNLEVQTSARIPGPLASFLRHCNTMDSPYLPSYSRGGAQPSR